MERLFQKVLEKTPADYQKTIIAAIRSLGTNPRPQGKRTKKLTGELIVSRFVAEYRLRVGPYRVLYDIDDQHKKVVLLNSRSAMNRPTTDRQPLMPGVRPGGRATFVSAKVGKTIDAPPGLIRLIGREEGETG